MITGIAGAKTTKVSANGDGTLAVVTFTAIAGGESHIKLQNVRLSDPEANLIPVTILDGSVTVMEYPVWDVNKDGQVDILDIVIVGQQFGEQITEPMESNPDVNGDGVVDILDIVLVGQHFGETHSSAAPMRDLWKARPGDFPLLIKLYEMMEDNPSPDNGFMITKEILNQIISASKIGKTAIFQNYPNPFNPETWIPYQLAEDGEVIIRIFNVSGNLVRNLNLGYKSAGYYKRQDKSAYWDGRNEAGEYAASGVYFYTIQAGEFIATKKLTVMR
ncbi:T9SS type A sorting domain-containing protein [Candidatus Poribacteria bacterium]|nr:T9SS type A sorting domain-containing protein [Candidatus Poribacteria bacterium]